MDAKDQKKYQIVMGNRGRNWRTGAVEFCGSTTRLNLSLSSAEKAREVVRIAEIETYRIEELEEGQHWDGKTVEESLDMTAFYARTKAEKEAEDKAKEERVALINALPEKFDVETGIEGLDMWVRREEYSYKPSYSSKIQGYFKIEFMTVKRSADGRDCGWFLLDNYLTKDGKFMKKRFKEDLGILFGSDVEARIMARYGDPRVFFNLTDSAYRAVQKMVRNPEDYQHLEA